MEDLWIRNQPNSDRVQHLSIIHQILGANIFLVDKKLRSEDLQPNDNGHGTATHKFENR